MSQSADTARATSVLKGPFDPSWGPSDSTREQRALDWFETLVWHNHEICSNCFAQLKVSRTFARDDWGNEGSDSWRTDDATLDNGAECRKDLTGETSSTTDSRAITRRVGQ